VTDSGFRCIPGRWSGRWPGQPKQKKGAPDEPVDSHRGDVDRYEQLRRRALCGEPSGWQLGLGVLAARRVAGWLRVWHTTVPTPERPSKETPAGLVGSDEMVAILASMALACVDRRR
jgi:hypothetical protein